MTTGPPLFLVSACGSAEEFVAAFRRYADRTGLFVPCAQPLPAGKRGRLALTLKDGGVMIEGEAEILQSSTKPTVLHGRPGMTVKFVEPDEPSKLAIGELEKARLALKPPPATVQPRPAQVPAEPRAVAPAPSGRIDAANALAECVVIGDVSTLTDVASAPKPFGLADKSGGGKFVVPAIPAMGGPRAKSASSSGALPAADASKSGPAIPEARAKTPSAAPLPIRPPPPPLDAAVETTNIGTAAPAPTELPKKKTTDPTIQSPPIEGLLEDDEEATAFGAIPSKKPTPPPMPVAAADANPRRSELAKNHKATSIGFPAMRTPFQTQSIGVVPPPAPPTLPSSSGRAPAPGPRGKTPTTPPLAPRHPTPVAPVPIVRSPAKSAPMLADEEQTDLGAAAAAVPVAADPAVASGAAAPPPTTQRSGGMRASEILAAIPNGDWTMTPDESIPHPLPNELRAPGPVVPEPPPRKPAPTGDWTIQLDPEKGSWSEPEKLGRAQPTKGNPVVAVASDKPINVVEWDEKPTGIGESKIEIDSTLMETARADGSGSQHALDATVQPAAVSDSMRLDAQPPPLGPTPTPPVGTYARRPEAPPFARVPSARPTTYPPAPRDFVSGATTVARDRSRAKMIALAVGAGALAIGAIVVLVLTLSGKDGARPAATSERGSAEPAVALPATPSDAASATPPAPADAGAEQAAVEPPADEAAPADETPKPATGGTCTVSMTSVPKGADVYVDSKKLGTTPGTFDFTCGDEVKVSLRKSKFANTVKSFTPEAGKPNKVLIKLRRDVFQVKVTSTPPGATITARGKQLGVTPTTIKLPAYDPTALTLTKQGYAPETSRVTPKVNNASHHVTLKKGRK